MLKRKGLLILAAVVLLLAMASTAFAKTVVVEKPSIAIRGPARTQVLETGPADTVAAFKARGDTVTVLDSIPDKAAAQAAGSAAGADEVWYSFKCTVESKDHFSGVPPFTMKRFNKGKTWLDVQVLDTKTGEVRHIVTPENEPWSVQPGDKASPWVLVGAGLLADAVATNHAFPYAGRWVRPASYVVGNLVYLVGTQANWTQSAAVVTGELLIGQDIFPNIGAWRWLGIAGVAAPFYTALGDPEQLGVMSFREAIENTVH